MEGKTLPFKNQADENQADEKCFIDALRNAGLK
jgi:hypothetical protein